jgi:hypothetical protein
VLRNIEVDVFKVMRASTAYAKKIHEVKTLQLTEGGRRLSRVYVVGIAGLVAKSA